MMQTYQIWRGKRRNRVGRIEPLLLGTCQGENFKVACKKFFTDTPYGGSNAIYYNENDNTFSDYSLFWDEGAARFSINHLEAPPEQYHKSEKDYLMEAMPEPADNRQAFEIWLETYEKDMPEPYNKPPCMGTWLGNDFRDACNTMFKGTPREHFYDPVLLTYMGHRLFDNEADARNPQEKVLKSALEKLSKKAPPSFVLPPTLVTLIDTIYCDGDYCGSCKFISPRSDIGNTSTHCLKWCSGLGVNPDSEIVISYDNRIRCKRCVDAELRYLRLIHKTNR